MIVGLGDDAIDWGFVDSLPMGAPSSSLTSGKSTITVSPATVTVKPKLPAPPASKSADAPSMIFGLPKPTAILVGGLVAAGLLAMLFSHSGWGGGGGRRVRNPKGGGVRSRDPEVQRAIDFRREFHWGYPARRVYRRKLAPTPRVLVELGRVHSVTYRTQKRGESAQLFEHTFEGNHPTLGMDIRNKRLHFVGGSYTVTADGITG